MFSPCVPIIVLLANEQVDIALERSIMAAVCELIDGLSALNAGVKSEGYRGGWCGRNKRSAR
jgi:hypothetical protein